MLPTAHYIPEQYDTTDSERYIMLVHKESFAEPTITLRNRIVVSEGLVGGAP